MSMRLKRLFLFFKLFIVRALPTFLKVLKGLCARYRPKGRRLVPPGVTALIGTTDLFRDLDAFVD